MEIDTLSEKCADCKMLRVKKWKCLQWNVSLIIDNCAVDEIGIVSNFHGQVLSKNWIKYTSLHIIDLMVLKSI
jgi:hypothetical protein